MKIFDTTLGEIWIKLFSFFGSIQVKDFIWGFNILMGIGFVLVEKKGFWRWFGIFSIITGVLNFIIKIFI